MATWTNTTQTAGNSIDISAGNPIGLLLTLTYSSDTASDVSQWTNTAQTADATWTNVTEN